MAIQFNCPYCTATVRVPDSAMGKMGRCPKCDTLVKVPTLPAAGGSDPSPQPVPLTSPQPQFNPKLETPFPVDPLPTPAPSPGVIEGEVPVLSAAGTFKTTERYLKSRKKSRRPNWMAVGLPLGMALILISIVWAYLKFQEPSYKGQLTGTRLSAESSFESLLSPERASINAADWQSLLDDLRESPVDLRSNLLTVRFAAADKAIQILVRPGLEADFVQVPMFDHAATASLVRKRLPTLEAARRQEIEQSLATFMASRQSEPEGSTALLIDFRDQLALNSHRFGLGRRCEAVVGQTRYPCVHEEADGRMTFLVPLGTTRFVIKERIDLKEKSLFTSPLELQVAVTQQLALPEERFEEPAPPTSTEPVDTPAGDSDSAPQDPLPNALNPSPDSSA